MKTTTPLTIALLSLSVLTACGGGGGHENFTSPPPPGTPVSDSSTAAIGPKSGCKMLNPCQCRECHRYWCRQAA